MLFLLPIVGLFILCIPQFFKPVHYCSRCGIKLGEGHECD